MAQPEYVPVRRRDRVQAGEHFLAPAPWVADRPGEIRPSAVQPTGPQVGVAGPDQGYALKLAHLLEDRVMLAPGEHLEDAVAGATGVAMRRAALYGRAPVMHDVELGFTAYGFFSGAPDDLIAFRVPLFAGVARRYAGRLDLAERVRESTLRMTPPDVSARLANGGWRALLN